MKTVKVKSVRLNDTHLWRMVDDTGIFQHAVYDVPDPTHGYTVDDNARLLMMACMYYEQTGKQRYLDTAYRALSFLLYARKDGWFRNFMGYDRRFLEERGSPDSYGRCIWCLGYVVGRKALPKNLRKAAKALLLETAPSAEGLTFLRSSAYAAMGFALCGHTSCTEKLAEHLARLSAAYHGNQKPGWSWYEDEITYCNASLPHALLLGYGVLGEKKLRDIGLESLGFLLENTTQDGFFWPVGCHGWHVRGGEAALYDQQPVEACNTLLACLTAHRVTGDSHYLDKAQMCLEWFLGNNSAGECMIDPASGGCYDGLEPDGVNHNQGSESLLAWYVSNLAMELYHNEHRG